MWTKVILNSSVTWYQNQAALDSVGNQLSFVTPKFQALSKRKVWILSSVGDKWRVHFFLCNRPVLNMIEKKKKVKPHALYFPPKMVRIEVPKRARKHIAVVLTVGDLALLNATDKEVLWTEIYGASKKKGKTKRKYRALKKEVSQQWKVGAHKHDGAIAK